MFCNAIVVKTRSCHFVVTHFESNIYLRIKLGTKFSASELKISYPVLLAVSSAKAGCIQTAICRCQVVHLIFSLVNTNTIFAL